jgi:type IX secretion system substrate protein/pregnancy-associated plasma protein-A
MKKILAGILLTVLTFLQLHAQQRCLSFGYLQQQILDDPSLQNKIAQLEEFTRQKSTITYQPDSRTGSASEPIKIPVVFHILYHQPEENISIQRIQEQLDVLNRDFRKRNPDTIKTPGVFAPFAADMEIEFHLAKSDPKGKSTNGIVRHYTPVKQWMSDDKMKFSSEYGDNAWDGKSYLNIWVCNLFDGLGYSAFPGSDPAKDGMVLNYRVVGNIRGFSQYDNGRTAVHEAGHWLNLRHIWGDNYCGDDIVDDTPKQATYTAGCPEGVRLSCSNGPNGDMYMNYMDFTGDACMNMFTHGQKQRARVLFEPGGARNSLLTSKGFNDPVIFDAALPDFYPKWLYAQVYPNPASNRLTIYFEYDERWMGKELFVIDFNGKIVMKKIIHANIQELDISKLNAGIYFIRAQKDDENILQKFIKL